MNLNILLSILREFGSEPTGEEIAEALWFMLRVANDSPQSHAGDTNSLQNVQSAELVSEFGQQTESYTKPGQSDDPMTFVKTSVRRPVRQTHRANLVARDVTSQSSIRQGGGLPVNIPMPPSLPDALNIARALRPLRRRVNSRTSFVLDERATAQRSADERVLVPMLRPQRTRWLSIDLVVDESETMLLWRPTVVDFLRLLARQSAFRDVRLWSLDTRSPIHPPHLYAGLRYGRGTGTSHSLNELIDPTGSRLVLVMSDCVAPGWHGGVVAQAIARWGARSPVAIIQVLPDWLWERSSLGREAGIEVRGLQPGNANTRLQVRLNDDWLEELEQLPTGIPIPVISLDAQSVKSWARFMVGSAETWIRGVMLSTLERRVHFSGQAQEVDAESRLRDFYASASLEAQALAERLSVAPLTLPVISLVQHAARIGVNQANVAEVLFSGLARQVTPTEQIISADEILFEFFPGVREALLMRLKLSEAYPVIETVTQYIEEARRIRTMRAAVAGIGEEQTHVPIIEDLPFARARAMLLRSIGYGQAAELLEQYISIKDETISLRQDQGDEILELPTAIEDEETHPDVNLLSEAHALLGALPSDGIPEPADSTMTATVHGDFNQAGGNIYQHSVHIELSDGAIFINNTVFERRWQRPTLPTNIGRTIPRTHDIEQVALLLADRGQVAISGPTAAAVQGMPGIGKTMLARQFARDLDAHYPDGVLWQEIGPQISADQVQRILNQWAQVALLLPPALDNNVQFDPGAVRALFRDRRLLVILDDVWSLDAVRPLREALPDGAHLILTTRLETVTVGLGGGRHVLGILTPEEARALIALRLRWPAIPADHQGWCDALAQGVGYHTLALDVALGVLRLDGDRPEDWRQTAVQVVAALRTGQGFDDLQIPDGDREHHVERVLAYSYERMDAVAQERFRLLGALAEEASWATAHIAQLWQCEEQIARRQMNTLVNAALLSRTEQRDRWQQHSLLRGYALALLRRAGVAAAASAQHAAIYDAAMQQADVAQQHHTMLSDYPQVRHAVAWAIANDCARAQNLINHAANLQAAFGFVRENLTWSLQARDAAQQRGTAADIARAHATVGNALQQVASLPGEERGKRLREALGAYDAALRFYRPETAPLDYAATENNRGVVLRDLASLPGEERGKRLREALGAYDAALRFYRPETAPLDYAATENNRGVVLRDLAALPGEERGERLRAALGAYDAALAYRRSETAPLDYADTEMGRGAVLRDLADLPGEERGERLRAALGAYEAALAYRRPKTAPLDYAMTQTNRGAVLRDLAALPGEERGERLRAALGAYDAALRFYRPETAPLDYAATEMGRGAVLRDLASLPGEERGERLRAALGAYEAALAYRRPETAPLDYAATEMGRGNVLRDLSTLPGEERGERLREALGAYEAVLRFYRPDTAPLDYAMTQSSLAMLFLQMADLPGELPHDRRRDALHALWTAFTAFTDLGHEPYQQWAASQLRWRLLVFGHDFLRAWEELDLGTLPDWLEPRADPPITGTPLLDALLASVTSDALNAFWQQVPLEEEQPFLDMVEQAITEAAHAGNSALAAQLGERRDSLRQMLAAQQQVQETLVALQAMFDAYRTRFENAERDDAPSIVWREVVAAGEPLLEPPFAGMEQVNWAALHAHLGTAYHHLGRALHREGNAQAAVAAYDRALQLQPDTVLWLCSRAAAQIDCGALDDAAADLAQARALEPDSPLPHPGAEAPTWRKLMPTQTQKTVAGLLIGGAIMLTGNAVLITVAGEVGVNWTSEGLAGLWGQVGVLIERGTPLSRAGERAIRRAVETLRRNYLKDYDRTADTWAFDLVRDCAGVVLDPGPDLRADSPLTAQQALAPALGELLHGHEPRQVERLQRQLLPVVAEAFRNELAADSEAWARYHGWLIECLTAQSAALTAQLDDLPAVLDALRQQPAAFDALRDALDALEAEIAALRAALERLEAGTGRAGSGMLDYLLPDIQRIPHGSAAQRQQIVAMVVQLGLALSALTDRDRQEGAAIAELVADLIAKAGKPHLNPTTIAYTADNLEREALLLGDSAPLVGVYAGQIGQVMRALGAGR